VTRAWYGTDLQGSVRYTTDDGGNVGDGSAGNVGGPAGYDPYGVPEGTSAPAPFGYTGELQDPGTGLVNLRARTYNPVVGQFLTRDPLFQRTGQAYAYANGDPVNQADPSGQFGIPGFAQAPGTGGGTTSKDAIIRDFLRSDTPGYDLTSLGMAGPLVVQIPYSSRAYLASDADHRGVADIIRLDPHPVNGRYQGEVYAVVPDNRRTGNSGYLGYPEPQLYALIAQARFYGLPFGAPKGVAPHVCTPLAPLDLRLGNDYAASDHGGATGPTHYGKYATIVDPAAPAPLIFGAQLQPGIIVYSQCRRGTNDFLPCLPPQQDACAKASNYALCVLDLFVFNGQLDRLHNCKPDDTGCHVASSIGIVTSAALTFLSFGGASALKGLSVGARESGLAADTARGIESGVTDNTLVSISVNGETKLLSPAQARQFLEDLAAGSGCIRCFPAGTKVATAKGTLPIERLRKGDKVLAEDPKTGKVEAELVQAVIVRPVSPLIELDLSDGSAIRVQPDHPFWVDHGQGLRGSGWLKAGELRPGDRLRTASGKDVTVVRVRRNVGRAMVYTLTVARDHTFFVGSARVLVHNATNPQLLACSLEEHGYLSPDPAYQPHHIVPTGVYRRFSNSGRLAHAQQILSSFGIDLNSYKNGVWLPGPQYDDPLPEAFHQEVHTNAYFATIDTLLSQARSSADAEAVLRQIGDGLARNDTTLYQ